MSFTYARLIKPLSKLSPAEIETYWDHATPTMDPNARYCDIMVQHMDVGFWIYERRRDIDKNTQEHELKDGRVIWRKRRFCFSRKD